MTTIAEYAEQIVDMVDEDIDAGILPATVRSVLDLHANVESGTYTTAVGVGYTGEDENLALIADIEDEVNRRLAARTLVAKHADRVMGAIQDDIDAGRVPATVRSFAELHDHLDANEYTADIETDDDFELVNAIENEVSRRLAAGAVA